MITDALNHHVNPCPVASENTFRHMVMAIMDGKEIEVNDGNTFIQIQPTGQTLTIS